MTKHFQHKIEYIFLKLLIFILNHLPLKIALRFGDVIGILAFSVLRIRRRVTLTNLRNSFGGEYTDKQYRKIGLRSYINFARSMIEYGMFPRLVEKDLSLKIKIVGQHSYREYLNKGAGVVLVSGHFGSWELMGAYLAQIGWPIDFLVGIQHNPLINNLMNKHRGIFGVGLIEVGLTARGVITALRKGRAIAMLSDQDAGADGVIVDFLGRAASTPKGPAAFALKTDCPIFVISFVRNELDKHTLFIEGPIIMKKTGDREEDIKRLTQAYTDIIEKYVRLHPDHWFWAHRRWKTTYPEIYH
ncbi:MAG: hypothetical protein B6D58_02185 [candidate division Zixibacteria bacterium 4484_95]|nr:MAG: hypothetical protein B6D58_02185 [candidate division Zixibacteria bacterium 4484_95]RKX19207.1 MAG: hypothetical protein DRP26_03830 [candidate division Zixibacteria bacterium]